MAQLLINFRTLFVFLQDSIIWLDLFLLFEIKTYIITVHLISDDIKFP